MFIPNRHLSRRTVLRGMGAAVALPFLEAMIPARSVFAQAPSKKLRFIALEMVHGSTGSTQFGIQKNLWAPAADGSAFDLAPTALSPLEPFRSYLTIVSNTDVRNAEAFIVQTGVTGLAVIPADRNLTGAEIEMVALPGRESQLRRFLTPLRDRFDHIQIGIAQDYDRGSGPLRPIDGHVQTGDQPGRLSEPVWPARSTGGPGSPGKCHFLPGDR